MLWMLLRHIPRHIILTLGQPVVALPLISGPSREQLVPFITALVCRGKGSNLLPPNLRAGTLPTVLPWPNLETKQSLLSLFLQHTS